MKFLKSLADRFEKNNPATSFEAALAPETSIFVIGDVHGCDRLLQNLLALIQAESRSEMAQIVYVGDYIDRGEESATVLRRLHQASTKVGSYITCLTGNHEEMLLNFLDNPEQSGQRWLRNGGLQTLASFKVGGASQNMSGADLKLLRDTFRTALGPALEEWLRALETSWSSGNVTVVHAGADPETHIDDQSRKTLIWGHANFTKKVRTDGQWIVHGHTIVDRIQAEQGRVGVDTGAFATGRLSAAHISNDGLKVLTATY